MEKQPIVSNFLNTEKAFLNTKIISLNKPTEEIGLLKDATIIKTKLCLSLAEGHVIISIFNILRMESDSNYTILFTSDNRKFVISKTLKVLEDVLPSKQFIRCHNSHLVNIQKISFFKKGLLILGKDFEIPIARQKYQAVEDAIESACITL